MKYPKSEKYEKLVCSNCLTSNNYHLNTVWDLSVNIESTSYYLYYRSQNSRLCTVCVTEVIKDEVNQFKGLVPIKCCSCGTVNSLIWYCKSMDTPNRAYCSGCVLKDSADEEKQVITRDLEAATNKIMEVRKLVDLKQEQYEKGKTLNLRKRMANKNTKEDRKEDENSCVIQ